MKKIGLLSLAIGLFMVLLQNCKHEIPTTTDPIKVTLSDTCSLDTVYFVNDILPIIISNCANSGCHDANTRVEDIQLTDYNNIINTGGIVKGDAGNSEFYEVITTTNADKVMPPPPASMTAEQKNAIRIWINQGAKYNECFDRCDTSNVTFSGVVWPILNGTCTGCHTPGNVQGGILITNYSEVKTLVDADILQNVLARNGPRSAMPPGGPLQQCADDQIRIWIQEGAQDN